MLLVIGSFCPGSVVGLFYKLLSMRPRLVVHKNIAKRVEGIMLGSAYVELGKVAGATFSAL